MKRWISSRSFPLKIFLVALVLRLIPVVAMPSLGIGLDDMFQYDMLARSIVAGNGYRWYAEADLPLIKTMVQLDFTSVNYDRRGVLTSFRPPLYPVFLALIYSFSGVGAQRFFVVRVIQAILAAFLPVLTFALTHCIYPDRPRVAIIAAWVITLYPTLIIYPLSLATENLFFFLLLSSVLVLLIAAKKPSWQWFVFAGILLGLTALTRSVSLSFSALALIWVWFVLHKRSMAIVLLATILLVTMPWVMRNSMLNHRLTGIESELGYNLYIGYHPSGTGTFEYPRSLDLLPTLDDAQRDTVGRQKAFEFIRADPDRALYLALRRAGYFFGLERRALTYFYSNDFFGYLPTALLLMIATFFCLPFVFVCASSVFGLGLSFWSKEIFIILLLFVGYITPHVLILAEDRFHLAIVPFLAIFAAYIWSCGRVILRERWQTPSGRIIILIALVLVGLLMINWGLELWRDAGKLALLLSPSGNNAHFSY